MNYLVFIKQVPDTATRIQLNESATEVDLSSVKWVINPYDEFALEEALRLREKSSGNVYVCTIGPNRCQEALRTALAMGVDKGLHIESSGEGESQQKVELVTFHLKEILKEIDVILCGKQSVDWGRAAFGPMMGQKLGWPSVSPCIYVTQKEENWEVERTLDSGSVEILEIKGPLVLCVTKGINEPRYISLPNIMKAKSKPIEIFKTSEDIVPSFSIKKISFPPERPPVKMIEGSVSQQVSELLKHLKKEGLI